MNQITGKEAGLKKLVIRRCNSRNQPRGSKGDLLILCKERIDILVENQLSDFDVWILGGRPFLGRVKRIEVGRRFGGVNGLDVNCVLGVVSY